MTFTTARTATALFNIDRKDSELLVGEIPDSLIDDAVDEVYSDFIKKNPSFLNTLQSNNTDAASHSRILS